MMTAQEIAKLAEMTDEQFQEHAIDILQRELGPDGLDRFVKITQIKTGDYTRDRHKWQKGITVKKIADDIAKRKAASA
jgi:hypothetical protein